MTADHKLNQYGTALLERIQAALNQYLGTNKAQVLTGSPVLTRIASRTGININAKQKNIHVAQVLQQQLYGLDFSDTDQNYALASGMKYLNQAIVTLENMNESDRSKQLLPALMAIKDDIMENQEHQLISAQHELAKQYAHDVAGKLHSKNIYEDLPELQGDANENMTMTRKDFARLQHRIFIDGQNLSDLVGKNCPENPQGDPAKAWFSQLSEALKKGKTDGEQKLWDDALPYLNQNGLLFVAGSRIIDEMGKLGSISGQSIKEIELEMVEEKLHITEYHIFYELNDTTDMYNPQTISFADNPIIYKHEFTVSHDENGQLKAATSNLMLDKTYQPRAAPSRPASPKP